MSRSDATANSSFQSLGASGRSSISSPVRFGCNSNLSLVTCYLSLHRGALERRDVDLIHLHHRIHDALGFRLIGIGQHIAENNRTHLPRETEFVFEPTARSGRSAVGGKFLPEIIDLVLGFAVD